MRQRLVTKIDSQRNCQFLQPIKAAQPKMPAARFELRLPSGLLVSSSPSRADLGQTENVSARYIQHTHRHTPCLSTSAVRCLCFLRSSCSTRLVLDRLDLSSAHSNRKNIAENNNKNNETWAWACKTCSVGFTVYCALCLCA